MAKINAQRQMHSFLTLTMLKAVIQSTTTYSILFQEKSWVN